jgi:DNA-binding CsgD family transcriptional regulator
LGDKRGLATALSNLGLVAYRQGENSLAEERSRKAFNLRQRLTDKSGLGHSLNNLGHIYLAQQNYVEADASFRQGFGVFYETTDWLGLVQNLEGFAELFWKTKKPEKAAALLALAQSHREAMGAPIAPVERPNVEKMLNGCRIQLGETAFNAIWRNGQALTLNESLDNILAKLSLIIKPRPALVKGGLTARQIEVLRLVAQGLTNAQIAESLSLSQLTVNSYLRTIYDKLGVSSRSAATRYVIENKLI